MACGMFAQRATVFSFSYLKKKVSWKEYLKGALVFWWSNVNLEEMDATNGTG